jgi:hypothetical protein
MTDQMKKETLNSPILSKVAEIIKGNVMLE